MNRSLRRIAPLLFVSGLCALVYQTTWIRELRLVFGASTAASAAVLAIFMGGLGLGGFLLGKRAEVSPQPLLFYANLELLIAASSAVTPGLVKLSRMLYILAGGTVTLGLAGGTIVRLILSALVLAVPTVLMGGTLPAAAKAAESEADPGRRGTAVLYGSNTLGAVAGTLLSTFLLLEIYGNRNTLWLACLVNALLGLTARSLARRSISPALAPPRADVAPPPLPPSRLVYGAAAVVGFAFFLMELVWYRMLSPLLGGSTFTFGLILAVALLGIGLGGAAYALFGERYVPSLRAFAFTCALEALCLGIPLLLGDRVALLAIALRALASLGFSSLAMGWAAIAALLVLPAAFVAGVQFPMLIALLGRGARNVGREVGLGYAWNTIGSIAGSLVGGFGAMPLLTAPGTWRLVIVLLVITSLASVAVAPRSEGQKRALWWPAAVAALASFAIFAPGPTAVWRHSPIGAGRADQPGATLNTLRKFMREARHAIIWEREGIESSVALSRGNGLAFIVNGKSDGNALGDAGTQVMSALIGAIFHPNPRRSLVIGLGTGSTAGWLGAIPSMERVNVVEIEPDIREVARRCEPVNAGAMKNPKVRVTIGDAREVVLAGREHYDIVFSEPSNPYRAGIASLFTRDFYRAVKKRLAPGGLFIQWVQGIEIDAPALRSVMATLASEFESVEAWQTQGKDLALVATGQPLEYDVERLRARIAEEPFKSALLDAWRVTSVEGFLAHFVATPRLSAEVAREEGDQISTDDRSHLEFAFARTVGRKGLLRAGELRDVAARRGDDRPPLRGQVDWRRVLLERLLIDVAFGFSPGSIGNVSDPVVRERETLYLKYLSRDETAALAMYRRAPFEPAGPVEHLILADLLAGAADETAVEWAEKVRPYYPADADALIARLRAHQRSPAEASAVLLRAIEVWRKSPWQTRFIQQRALETALLVASLDKSEGRKLYDALSEPFAMFANDDNRLLTRVSLAETIDFRSLCAGALQQLEPHAPWTGRILSARVLCYGENRHPLATRAREEYDRYLEDETPAFLVEEPEAPAASR